MKKMFDFSYINADEDSEIDLIIERARVVKFLIEFKSSTKVTIQDAQSLINYKKDFPDAQCFCLSRDANERFDNGVFFYQWQTGLKIIFDC